MAFDKFAEGTNFCVFIWNLENLSYCAKNFLIHFITNNECINHLTLQEISSIYREIQARNIQMNYGEICKYIAFFAKFLSTKSPEFHDIFLEQVNKELSEGLAQLTKK